MRVRWTLPALQQLAQIIRYIRKDDPAAALRVKVRIQSAVARLDSMPDRYPRGLVEGTREITFSPWPYVVVYEVSDPSVFILAVRHGAQQWPPDRQPRT